MNKQWNAVVLAGDRGLSDPVATAAGVKGKAFAKLGNNTLIERVISALRQCDYIKNVYSVGPDQEYLVSYPAIQSFLEQQNIYLSEPAFGPSASAFQGVMQSDFYPTLVVTCDLALLNAGVLEKFCEKMSNVDADFVACAIDYGEIHAKIPMLKKTQYKFGNQVVCFANVFAVLNSDGLKAIQFWQDVEKSRKKPIQLIRKIDWLSLVNYKLGRLSLEQVAARLSDKVGANLKIEFMNNPELAIDVDSAHDYQIMNAYLSD